MAAIRYKDAISKIDRIKIPFGNYCFLANYHIFPILLDKSIDRHSLMVFLRDKGIQTSIHYPPIHNFSFYRKLLGIQNLPLTEYIAEHELTLPMFVNITNEQIDFIIDSLRAYCKNI